MITTCYLVLPQPLHFVMGQGHFLVQCLSIHSLNPDSIDTQYQLWTECGFLPSGLTFCLTVVGINYVGSVRVLWAQASSAILPFVAPANKTALPLASAAPCLHTL